jgi:hypothetical protein
MICRTNDIKNALKNVSSKEEDSTVAAELLLLPCWHVCDDTALATFLAAGWLADMHATAVCVWCVPVVCACGVCVCVPQDKLSLPEREALRGLLLEAEEQA